MKPWGGGRSGRLGPGRPSVQVPRFAGLLCPLLVAVVLGAGLLPVLTVSAQAQARLSISGPASAPEGDSGERRLDYTVSLSESLPKDSGPVAYKVCFTTWTLRGFTATQDKSGNADWQEGSDYRLVQGTNRASNCTGNFVFTPGGTLSRAGFWLEVRGDTDAEGDEEIIATVEVIGRDKTVDGDTIPWAELEENGIEDDVVRPGNLTHSLNILNDDHGTRRMILSTGTLSVTEGQSASFTVKMSEEQFPTHRPVTVMAYDAEGGSTSVDLPSYYPNSGNPRLIIAPGIISFNSIDKYNVAQTFTVHAIPDNASVDETIMLRLRGQQSITTRQGNYFTPVFDGITLNIKNVPLPAQKPVVSITPVDEEIGDGKEYADFKVSRTGPTTSSMVVKVSISEKVDEGQRFFNSRDLGDRSIFIDVGSSSKTYRIPLAGDRTDEPNGEITVSIREADQYIIDGDASNAVTVIHDDDGPQLVSIIAGTSPIVEGAGAEFEIRRTGGPIGSALTVGIGVQEKDAAAGDFVDSGEEGRDKTVTIPANRRKATYSVPTVDDGVDEPDGSVSVWIRSNNSVYRRHGDNDLLDDFSLIETTVAVTDNDGDGDNSAPSVANPIPDRTATVGTAFSFVFDPNTFSDPDGDLLTYVATGEDDAGLTFNPSSRTFSGTPQATHAGQHDVTVTASDGNGNSVSDTFTINVEDPNLPVVSITGGSDVDEGSPAEFTVSRAESAGSALTVLLSVGEDTEDGRNYVSSGNEGNRTVTIPADETSFTFEVATVDDATDEPDGEVRVSIRESASNYTIDSTGQATVAVNDDDAPNLSIQGSVAIRALTVIEGGSASYGVALGGRPSGSVSVDISIEGDDDAPDLGLDPSSLTFDTDDWNVPQTVTISAGEDEDKTSESVTLVHAVREGSDEREVRLTLTIRDNDIPPSDVVEAGLVRFGRTVGEQSVSAIRGRLDSPPYIGFGGTFAGHALSGVGCDDDPHAPGCSDVTETATSLPAHDQSLPGDQSPHPESRALEADEIVAGTSFTLTRERGSGNVVTLWGQGSRSGFEGRTGLISLDGDVTGFMLGWDSRERDRLHGFMLSLSSGDVRYDAAARTGSMDLELTALIPYASRTLKNDIRVWGALGFGSGSLTRLEDGVDTVRSGIDWRMAALGAGGDLPPSGALAGAALTWHADLLWTRTGADAVVDGWEELDGRTLRSRVGVEAAWEQVLGNGTVLRPILDVGIRHDAGDAETGLGVEIGGGLEWTDPEAPGISLLVRGRKLVVHADDDFDDWGVRISLAYDPSPMTREGFSARVSHDLGGLSPDGGPLLGADPLPGGGGLGTEDSWTAEMAHGTDLGQGRVGSPYMAVREGTSDRTTRLGYRMEPDLDNRDRDYSIDLWAEPETGGGDGKDIGRAGLNLATRW